MWIKKFNDFLADLNNPVTDEWYMSKFVDENIKVLESYEAFDILKAFISYMIEHYDSHSEYEIVEALRYLKLQSDTNQIFYNDEQKIKF